MPKAPEIANQQRLPLAGVRALVMGLGRFGGGTGVTRWLSAQGARVTVTDQADPEALADSIQAIADLDITLHLGGHDLRDLDHADLVVVNPAVDKRQSRFFQEVAHRRIPWTTEMNLFCERCPATVIGVTGSYGKSTVCAMLADGLTGWVSGSRTPYRSIYLGGNIGRSLLADLERIGPNDLVVLEMSNAQLEDLPRIAWAPQLAVINNLWPHHLDRYGGLEGYVTAKLHIVESPGGTSRVFIGEVAREAQVLLDRVFRNRPVQPARLERPNPPVELRLAGDHNQANAAAVIAVCRHLGMEEALVREVLHDFPGLPHRLQYVRTISGADYYDDSKSTSPAAALAAVNAFDRPVVMIVGGQARDGSLTEWADAMVKRARMVICTGESGPALAEALRVAADPARRNMVREAATLEEAVASARRTVRSDEVVLFSPGAPSFDRYANFAERGRHFIEIVENTASGHTPAPGVSW